MVSPTTDRRQGLVGNAAIKVPVACATTANITLSGEQTIDGVTTSESRVLVKNQTTSADNGIYDSSSGSWTRAADFNGTYDAVVGTLVNVISGSTLGGSWWSVSGSSAPTIGTSSITFGTASLPVGSLAAQLADTTSDANNDALIGVKRSETGSAATTQHVVNQARDIFVAADRGAATDGTTSATTAINSAATNGGLKRITFEVGNYATQGLAFSISRQHWRGQGWTSSSSSSDRPGASLLKNANGTHLTMSGLDAGLTDLNLDGVTATYTGDGLVVSGERSMIENVSVVKQRGVGIRWGANAVNGNLWLALRPLAVTNGGDGGYIHHTGGAVSGTYPAGLPDINAGVMIGGDFRLNGGVGLKVENAIDNVFVGVAAQDNTGKGIVLKDGARGHMFLHPYTEGNNGGAAAAGDELDIELGAVQNAVIGMRFQDSGGSYAGLRDVNAPGKNWIEHYEPGVGEWIRRGKFSVWNPQQDASSTSVDISAYLGSSANNVFNLKGSIFGASGGTLTIQTKRDGNTPTDKIAIDGQGRIFVQLPAQGIYMGATTSFPSLTSGAGTPEAAVTAVVGSLYLRTNGGAGTSLYVKESGSGNTGWVGK